MDSTGQVEGKQCHWQVRRLGGGVTVANYNVVGILGMSLSQHNNVYNQKIRTDEFIELKAISHDYNTNEYITV